MLSGRFPDAKPGLDFENAFELLIATILSAQCTDKQVNIVTKKLFAQCPTVYELAALPLEELETIIKSCGFYHTKAKNVLATCKLLIDEHGGEVPCDREALEKLPGVGRKTAGVVLAAAFGVPAIAVDTHVFRVSNRIGLVHCADEYKTELALMEALPRDMWILSHYLLILHGRNTCYARRPLCAECGIAGYCDKFASDSAAGGQANMNEIVKKEWLSESVARLRFVAPRIAAKAEPGQFLMLRVGVDGERIPLTITDYDRSAGTVDIIVQAIGASTHEICLLNAGDTLADVAGPLGCPSDISGVKRVLMVGGGVGTAVLLTPARMLIVERAEIDVVIGARNKTLIILDKELSDMGAQVHIATDDGSAGTKGFVTDVMKSLHDSGNRYDAVMLAGPMIMMKNCARLTKGWGTRTIASMNPLMVDGTGMCGCCRVSVGGKTLYACVDGPDFDAQEVDFDEAMRRLTTYAPQEKAAMERYKHECACAGQEVR